jgi:hypothetical protein
LLQLQPHGLPRLPLLLQPFSSHFVFDGRRQKKRNKQTKKEIEKEE